MYAAALFDLDGLLIDSERVIMDLWVEAARAAGHGMREEDFAAVIGRAEQESEEILASMLGGRGAFEAVRAAVMQRFRDPDRRLDFPLKRGAVELLTAVRAAGVACGVASSTRSSEVRRRLRAVGLLDHIDALAGGDEVIRGKPDPAVYELAAARLGVPAGDCLAFEDSENGALAALAAGAQVVLVPDLRALPESLTLRSVRVLESLVDAVEHVPAWFGSGPARGREAQGAA
jgi:HAD superfamily hydrolase (TIGR01509 family)